MTQNETIIRDYSLIGVESEEAIRKGLADAEWYTTPIPKAKMRELLTRKDGPAIRDTLLWFGLILGSGMMVYVWWGTWFAVFPYVIYSVLYASTSDSRWHEAGHGTAFKTDWMNNFLYEVASFMVLRQSTVWRWSHTRHHSDTIIRGRDPEIAVPRPPDIKKILLVFVGISSSIPELKKLLKHVTGKIDPEVATFVPVSEHKKVIFKARIYLSIFLVVIALSISYQTVLPLMYVGIPTLLGSWLMPVYGLTQHAGLQENVLDHRLNCRTVYMNRIHRFLYWNMNYHVEHHMFPLVPYHALPKLHELTKHDCPKPYNGIIETYKEIIPALLKQVKDPWYYVERKLPDSANKKVQKKERITGDLSMVLDGKVEVCTVDKLDEGDIIRFDFDQRTYAVYKSGDRYFATDGICTHGNAHLSDGMIIGDMIECSKHNGRFSLLDGSPKRLPVCVGLNTYNVEVIDDKIYLNLESLLQSEFEKENEGISFNVISNENVATYIKELVLEMSEVSSFRYQPGQYAQFIVPPYNGLFNDFSIQEPYGSKWKERKHFDLKVTNPVYVKRNYSFATNPDNDRQLKFNVKLSLPSDNSSVNPGVGSSYLFNLKQGDKIKLSGPYGDFLIRQSAREMVYIGGGAGMAPLRSHLSYLFETEKTKRKVSYWYGARSKDDLFYIDYFEGLEGEHDNFKFRIALSEPDKGDDWNGLKGFIADVVFQNYLQSHPNPANVEYYLCGPLALIQSALHMLDGLNVPEEMIAYDEFD